MAYSQLLNKVIKDSKLSIKEIVDKCEKYSGVNITSSYISQLKAGKMNTPSDEVSRAIALACSQDSELLVIESYIDKAPIEIINVLNILKLNSIYGALSIYEDENSKEFKSFQDELMKIPLSQIILQISKTNSTDMTDFLLVEDPLKIDKVDENFNKIKNNRDIINKARIPMEDDSMEKIISKNDLLSFERIKEIVNGDILAYIDKETSRLLIRRVYKNDSRILMVAENKNYEPKVYNEKDIDILGKVSEIIVKM